MSFHQENVEYIYNGTQLTHIKKKKRHNAICSNTDGPRDDQTK